MENARGITLTSFLAPLALAACTGAIPGAPVASSDLCSEIAHVVCDTDTNCFPERASADSISR